MADIDKAVELARVESLYCRHCGIQWPGDDAITLDDLARRATPNLPVCINPAKRWFVDSGINGHVFDVSKEARHG